MFVVHHPFEQWLGSNTDGKDECDTHNSIAFWESLLARIHWLQSSSCVHYRTYQNNAREHASWPTHDLHPHELVFQVLLQCVRISRILKFNCYVDVVQENTIECNQPCDQDDFVDHHPLAIVCFDLLVSLRSLIHWSCKSVAKLKKCECLAPGEGHFESPY